MSRLCKKCRHHIEEDDMDFDCSSSVGMYGAIVVADIYHKQPCGGIIAKSEIVDNDGNIPPDKEW